jgi:hypothetical protein
MVDDDRIAEIPDRGVPRAQVTPARRRPITVDTTTAMNSAAP